MNLPKKDALELRWFVDENFDDIYVERPEMAPDAVEGLFDADWATKEHAEHVARLHNAWLERKNVQSGTNTCWGRLVDGVILTFDVGAPLVGVRFTEIHLRLSRTRLDGRTMEWVSRIVFNRIADLRNTPVTIEVVS